MLRIQWADYTDSMLGITALKNKNMSNSLIIKLLNRINSLNIDIFSRWIPSHVGIIMNERLDLAAKEASTTNSADSVNTKTPYTDLKPTINMCSRTYGTLAQTIYCRKLKLLSEKGIGKPN